MQKYQKRAMRPTNGGGSHDLPPHEQWATSGSQIGGWVREVPLHEHHSDLRAARARVDQDVGRHTLAMGLSSPPVPTTSSAGRRDYQELQHHLHMQGGGPQLDGPKEGSYVGDVMDFQLQAHGFPGKPQASRGHLPGKQPQWSFERNPSLLHDHMNRDRGKLGRPVAGVPPPYLRQRPPPDPEQLAEQAATGQPRGPYRSFSSSAIPPVPRDAAELKEIKRSTSAAFIGPVAPRGRSKLGVPLGGLHAHIGTTWDDASKIAGDKYQGSAGKLMGF